MDETTQQLVAMLGVIGLGLLLGRVSWRNISLGTSGVVFVALAAGHFGFEIPRIAGVAGIVLFVYCLGLGSGPSFLRTFLQQGKSLAVMAVCMIVSAGLVAWLAAVTFRLTPALTSGLFAGALTSTPALAAAVEHLPNGKEVAVGFGIAYPFGVLGVLLFVQLVPRMFADLGASRPAGENSQSGPISRVLVSVSNPGVVGKKLNEVATIAHANCQVSRLLVDGRMQPIPPSFRLDLGQRVLVIGSTDRLPDVIEVLGKRADDADYILDVERQRRRVVITSRGMVGKSLHELQLLSKFGVTISRINRQDIEFVPGPQTTIQFGDAAIAIGESEGLDQFVEFAGHREKTLDETDFVSLACGLLLGIMVGQIELTLGGRAISLGLAGGPLLVGLILGSMGRVGPFTNRMPRAARLLLSEIGLALFLGQAGTQAGGQFVTVIAEYGFGLPLAAVAIVTVPLVVGLIVAHFILRLGMLETSGGICGAMTSTPGLGAVMSAVDSSLPATSYAAVYPLALILITLLAPLLIAQVF